MASSARIDELRKKFDENPRRYFAPLANEYRKAGDLEQAIFICQEYLPQQPGHMSGHIVYGQALFEQARVDEARAVFETALSLDPENLIALRHLGDIARQRGDSRGARAWYQRVLEADPRNEEIAQLMMSLLATPDTSHPGIASHYDERDAQTGNESTIDDRFSAATSTEPDRESALPETQATSELSLSPEPATWGAPAVSNEELLDLDDFSVGGVPLSSLTSTPEIDEPLEPFPTTNNALDGLQSNQADDLEFTESLPTDEFQNVGNVGNVGDVAQVSTPEAPVFGGDADFEADPFAIAASPQQPATVEGLGAVERIDDTALGDSLQTPDVMEEFAADLSSGLPDDGTAPSMSEAPDDSVLGLETFSEGFIGATPEAPAAAEVESFFDTSVLADETSASDAGRESATDDGAASNQPSSEMPAAQPDESRAAALEPAPDVQVLTAMTVVEPEPLDQPFLTETMAELYLQQGHVDAALDIYQQLVAQRPDEPQLRDRLHAIEGRIRGTSAAFQAESEAEAMAAAVAAEVETQIDETQLEMEVDAQIEVVEAVWSGPTIREFLVALLHPEAPVAEELAPLADDISTLENQSSVTPPPTPPSSETISGSIDALFAGADASAADATAASTLADAFAPDAPTVSPLEGMPARQAASELSLDHVFKAPHTPRPESDTGTFSFDQFFADELTEPPTSLGAEPPATPGSPGDDIAQFNEWLNGLKKT